MPDIIPFKIKSVLFMDIEAGPLQVPQENAQPPNAPQQQALAQENPSRLQQIVNCARPILQYVAPGVPECCVRNGERIQVCCEQSGRRIQTHYRSLRDFACPRGDPTCGCIVFIAFLVIMALLVTTKYVD